MVPTGKPTRTFSLIGIRPLPQMHALIPVHAVHESHAREALTMKFPQNLCSILYALLDPTSLKPLPRLSRFHIQLSRVIAPNDLGL
jgi:hypothetical protein